MVESTLLKEHKHTILIIIIFALLIISAASLFGGWKYINHLQIERDLLKTNNKELFREKEKLQRTLDQRQKEYEKILDEREFLKLKIVQKEKELEQIEIEYEKDIINISDSDINGDIGEVSNIFSNHSRR